MTTADSLGSDVKDAPGAGGTFILGSGRCGSTMLSDMLNLHPDVLSVSEFFAMQGVRSLLPGEIGGPAYWERLSRQTKSMQVIFTPETAPREFLYDESMGRFPIDQVPPLMISPLPHITETPQTLFDELQSAVPSWPSRPIEQHHDHLFQILQKRMGRKLWVERTGLSQMYAKLLPELFPKAKFVLMYRDGRDVVLSMRAFKPIRPAIWNWKWSRFGGPNPIDINAPAGRSRRLEFNDRFMSWKPLINWMINTPPSLKDCSAFWSELTLSSLSAFQWLAPERRHYLTYERLVTDPHSELQELGRFLGAQLDSMWLDEASMLPQRLEPRWQKLDPEEQRSLTGWTEAARGAAEDVIGSAN